MRQFATTSAMQRRAILQGIEGPHTIQKLREALNIPPNDRNILFGGTLMIMANMGETPDSVQTSAVGMGFAEGFGPNSLEILIHHMESVVANFKHKYHKAQKHHLRAWYYGQLADLIDRNRRTRKSDHSDF